MRRAYRVALVLVLAAVPAVAGCGKDEGKPNPDNKIPDVPPSGSSVGKGDMSTKDKSKK